MSTFHSSTFLTISLTAQTRIAVKGSLESSLFKHQSLHDGSVTPEFPIPPDTNNVNKSVVEFEWLFRNTTFKKGFR